MFGPVTAFLWTVNFVVLVAVLYLLLRRQLWRDLPVFAGLVALSVACSAILQVLAGLDLRTHYYFFSWFSRAIQGILGVAVVHEVLRKVLYGYHGLRNLAGSVYWIAIVILLAAAVAGEGTIANHGWYDNMTRALGGLDRALMFLSAGLMVVVFALIALCGMPWRRLVFGVAFGLGLYSSIKLALITAYSHLGVEWFAWYTLGVVGNGVLQAAVWLAYVAVPEPQSQAAPPVVHYNLERWNSALQEVLQR